MASTKPVPVLVVYHLKDGSEDQFRALLAKHWPTLDRLGLVTATKPNIWTARGRDGKLSYIETMEWKDEGASDIAHKSPEVMQIWEPMGPILENLEIYHLNPVEL